MEGKHGHLNFCEDYINRNEREMNQQEQGQNLTNLYKQFPVVENFVQPSFMGMEEYSRIVAPDHVQGSEQNVEPNVEGLHFPPNENGLQFQPNKEGLHFQDLLLEELYDYFSNAKKRRPNRTTVEIQNNQSVEYVSNRSLGRLFSFATEWQIPAEGLFFFS
jgi:hypothetical protein